MTAIALTEQISDWHAERTVEPQARLVRNVALAGCESRNGYVYSEFALQSAAALYLHKPVFLDHAADRRQPLDRSTRDLVGSIVDARFERGRIRGDIQVLDTESGRTFLALAAADTPGVGMSHVVMAERSADGGTIERIVDVVSVDAVINPATTRTFHESSSHPADTDAEDVDVSHWSGDATPPTDDSPTSTVPDPATASVSETGAYANGDAVETAQLRLRLDELRHERDALALRLHNLVTQTAHESVQQRIDRLLVASPLPAGAVTDLFRRQLADAATDDVRRALIQERAALVQRLLHRLPASQERASPHPPTSNSRFINTIRHH